MRNASRLMGLAIVYALVASTVIPRAAVSTAPQQEPPRDGAPLAQVVAVIGEVWAVSDGSRISLTEPQTPFPLRDSDRLETGDDGRASVLFADGTLVRVNSSSIFEVETSSGLEIGVWARLRILLGEVLIHVIQGNENMQFETPDAIAAVRGTYFDIQVASAVDGDIISSITTLTTLEGLVAFSSDGGETEVGAAQRSTVRSGGAPTRPESIDLTQSLARLDTWIKDLKDREPVGLRKAGASEDAISQYEKAGLRNPGLGGQGNGAGAEGPRDGGTIGRSGSSASQNHPERQAEQQTERQGE